MAYINPKLDYKEGDILYGSDLNASNLVIKKGVDDNYDKIKDIEVFNTELDTDITNLEVALEENVTALEKSIADNVTILEKSIDDNLKKIEAVERFTTDLESDINTLASGASPIATKHTRGFVQVGDNLNVDSNGVISGKDPYVLPIATDNVIGGVSIGANIDTDGKGKISVKGVKGSNNISVVEQDGNYHIAYTGGNFKKEIVEELPPVGKDDVIYLLKKDTASGSDIYDEYLWIDGVWNPIGSTDVDLSNYYDKETVDEKLEAKADKGDVGGKEVFVSSTQPSDTSMQIWIDESEDGSTFDPTSFYKKEETDELLEELDTTLTEYVDTVISELDVDLPIATSDVLGGIKVGDNLTIDENGVLSGFASGIMVLTEDVVIQLNTEYYASTTSLNFHPVTVALKYGCGIYKIDVDAKLYTSQNVSKGAVSKGDIMIVFNKGKDILFFVSPVTASHFSAIVALHTNSTISTSISYTMYSTNNSDMANWFAKFTSLNKALTTDNTASFTPYSNYHPTHKKYVDDAINNLQTQIDNIPTSGGGSGGEVNYINVIHSNKDKFIEDLEVGKLYYLTGDWYYKKDNITDIADVNFSGGYIGYVIEAYTNNFRFEGIRFESAFGIKTIEILDIYGENPTSLFGRVREPADNLTTDYGDIALSARQGMVLKELIDNINPELPVATSEVLGGIKVGENLEIDENGILSAISGGKIYLNGTAENPINLNELDNGIYLCSGSYRQNANSNVTTFDYSNTVIFKSQTNCWGIGTDYNSSITFFLYIFYGAYQPNSVSNTPTKYRYCQPVNNLTSNDTYKSLSAAQGKALNDRLKIVESNYNKRINWHYGTSSSADSLYYLGSGVHYVGNYIKQNDRTSIQKIDRPMLLLMDGSTMAVGLSIDMSTGDLYTHTLPSAGNSSSSSTTINTKKIGCTIEDNLTSGSTTNAPSVNAVNKALANYQSKVLSGTSDPTSDIGNDGDIYFQYTE